MSGAGITTSSSVYAAPQIVCHGRPASNRAKSRRIRFTSKRRFSAEPRSTRTPVGARLVQHEPVVSGWNSPYEPSAPALNDFTAFAYGTSSALPESESNGTTKRVEHNDKGGRSHEAEQRTRDLPGDRIDGGSSRRLGGAGGGHPGAALVGRGHPSPTDRQRRYPGAAHRQRGYPGTAYEQPGHPGSPNQQRRHPGAARLTAEPGERAVLSLAWRGGTTQRPCLFRQHT